MGGEAAGVGLAAADLSGSGGERHRGAEPSQTAANGSWEKQVAHVQHSAAQFQYERQRRSTHASQAQPTCSQTRRTPPQQTLRGCRPPPRCARAPPPRSAWRRGGPAARAGGRATGPRARPRLRSVGGCCGRVNEASAGTANKASAEDSRPGLQTAHCSSSGMHRPQATRPPALQASGNSHRYSHLRLTQYIHIPLGSPQYSLLG